MIHRSIYFLLFVTGIAFGQTLDTTRHSDDSLRHVSVKTVVVTTDIWNSESYLSPSTVTIRSTQELIQLAGSASLGSAMALAHPSLDVRSYGTQSGIALASFRGLPAEYTAVYRNGIRITNAQHSLADLSKSGIRFADNIEIISGANDAMLGADIGGAAINIVSREPSESSASFGSHITSYDNLSSSAEKEIFGQGIIKVGSASIKAGASFNRDIGDYPFYQWNSKQTVRRSNNDSYLTLLDVEPSITLSDVSWLRSLFTFAQTERGVPGVATTDGSGASSPFARQFDKDLLGGFTFETEHSDNWESHIAASYQSQFQTYNDSLINIHDEYTNHIFNASLRTQYSQANRYQLVAKVDFDRNTLTSNENIDTTSSQIIRDQIAGFLAAQYNMFDNFTITGTARMEYIPQRNESRLLPSLSLGYSSMSNRDTWNTDISFGTFYHPPTLNALFWKVGGNPKLISEDGSSAEASFGWKSLMLHDFTVQLRLTAYYTRLHNQILWLPGKQFWSPQNILESQSTGLELDGTMEWTTSNRMSLILHQQFALNQTKNLSDGLNIGKRLPYSVPFRSVTTLSVSGENYGTLSGILRFRAARFTDLANNPDTKLPSVSILNLQYNSPSINLFRDLPLTLDCRVTNITNVQYSEIPNSPLPGMSISFGITFSTK